MEPVEQSSASVWRPVDAETGKIGDVEGLQQLARDFPDSGSVRLRLLQPLLAAGETDRLLATLGWLKERGYVFSSTAQEQIPKLVGEEFADAAKSLLISQGETIAASEVIATVAAEAGLVESVLMDLDSGRMAVTSVSGRSVWGGRTQGSWQEMKPDRAANLSGIVFDPVRNTIWAASGNIDGGPEVDHGFAGLVEIRPSGDGVRIPAPAGANLSDLHRAADGTIFASDPLGGGIYRLRPGEAEIEMLVAPGNFRSPQGLATSADGSLLYVSDYRYGLAIVPLSGGSPKRLATDLPVLLDGIDGLWRNGNELIAVQNGTSPMKIVGLTLSADGMRVVAHRLLEQANPEWTEPLSGYLGRGALYYVGNGQWDRWVAGQPAQDKPFGPTQIRRLPLDP
ncbi:MAG: hypothetical protein R3E14_13710 [Erythrobacter sp.]